MYLVISGTPKTKTVMFFAINVECNATTNITIRHKEVPLAEFYDYNKSQTREQNSQLVVYNPLRSPAVLH